MKLMTMLLLVGLLAGCSTPPGTGPAAAQGQITCYPTYGYQAGDNWVIPMRLWVHQRRPLLDQQVPAMTSNIGGHSRQEQENFRSRIQGFVADSESGETVTIRFDGDPDQGLYQMEDEDGKPKKSDGHGVIEGTIKIALARAQGLLKRQGSQRGWLSYQATSPGSSGSGKVQLIDPEGLSVISDIDDTIKITEIPAGPKVVVENTFFRDFKAAPGMAKMYQDLATEGARFHYVSGGPWQLYGPLSEFLFRTPPGFPEGSFNMKDLWLNPLSSKTWEGLIKLVSDENATYCQKRSQISTILQHFPQRRFILIGDSGEKDPEVYREIQGLFPKQVQEIRIRDVIDARQKDKDRLKGMSIIAAETVPTPRRSAVPPHTGAAACH